MGRVEIGNFYCLIGDNRTLFLQKCLLNSSPPLEDFFSDSLNIIGCRGNVKSEFSKKSLFLKNK